MNWFWTALIATLCWGAADLFYKRGANEADRYSHWKTTALVGIAFGIHAASTLLFADIAFDWRNLLYYAPVSLLYILSMVVGYFGLRYLELSVASPVQNCSGALAALLGIVILRELPDSPWIWVGIVLCCAGVFLLGLFEKQKQALPTPDSKKHRLGFAAFFLPIAYCVIDTLGTFLDDPCLSMDTTWLVNVTEDTIEQVGNTAYELTFFLVGLFCILGIFLDARRRKERVVVLERPNVSRVLAALFETAGQFAYVHVIGGNAVVAAPMIASYCVVSVALSRLFLKERLPARQYLSVAITFGGIVLLGIADGLSGSF